MECISYINDLQLEINILKDILKNGSSNLDTINEQIKNKEALINRCIENLSKLSNKNIEYRIYKYILEGLSISKAISKVAEENYLSGTGPTAEVTIYKYYYPKLKKIINV